MRRLLRSPLNVATAVSLTLCAAMLVMWFRSLFVYDVFPVRSANGELAGAWRCKDGWFGFVGAATNPKTGRISVEIGYGLLNHAFPSWFLIFGAGPFIRLIVWAVRDNASRPAGLCPACGYDLRATPDRCPECGHQPSS